jgi:hypothetical protein
VDDTAIDRITATVLQALVQSDEVSPAALRFLVRQYALTGRNDVGEALSEALARALVKTEDGGEGPSDGDAPSAECQAESLLMFVEAVGLSEDERLVAAVGELLARLEARWPSRGAVTPAMRSLDACLSAARLEHLKTHVPPALDELERIIGLAYVPGDGVARVMGRHSREPGGLMEHATSASALLSAYRVTGRLPYPMLAEELMQHARRSWWDDERGGFRREIVTGTSDERFLAGCLAAQVFCRLAALHQDPEYRQIAVIAQQSDYAADAGRALDSLAEECRTIGIGAASYGLALTELHALGVSEISDRENLK